MTEEPDEELWQRRCRHVFALLREAHVTERPQRLNLYRWILHDDAICSTNDLSVLDLQAVIDLLDYWKRNGELEARAREHT